MRLVSAVVLVVAIGDAMVVYKPGDPKYQETLEHLGGMKPGEEKSVPPWPEE
jgi:hypothetical protein